MEADYKRDGVVGCFCSLVSSASDEDQPDTVPWETCEACVPLLYVVSVGIIFGPSLVPVLSGRRSA